MLTSYISGHGACKLYRGRSSQSLHVAFEDAPWISCFHPVLHVSVLPVGRLSGKLSRCYFGLERTQFCYAVGNALGLFPYSICNAFPKPRFLLTKSGGGLSLESFVRLL